jgi:multicomponent Na+:H+ antiporter subunit E
MSALALRGALFALLWWMLTEGRSDGWAVGLVFIVLALAVSLHVSPPMQYRLSTVGLLAYVGFFVVQSVRGGLQVAGLALRPRLALAPALMEVPLRLPPGPAVVLLVGILSLLPGTLSVRLDGATLSLHVLDGRLPIEHEVRLAEDRIARLFGIDLA